MKEAAEILLKNLFRGDLEVLKDIASNPYKGYFGDLWAEDAQQIAILVLNTLEVENV